MTSSQQNYRQPTTAEAVAWLLASMTLEYRRQCMLFWRKEFGDEFADSVGAEVKHKWKKKNG